MGGFVQMKHSEVRDITKLRKSRPTIMNKLLVLLLGATFASTVVAHPHSRHHNGGECMEMRTTIRGSRSLWFSDELECMDDIEPSRDEAEARKICKGKARRYVMDFFKEDKIDAEKNTTVDDVTTQRDLFYAKCMVERLDLITKNESLDTNKLLQNAVKMDSSDSEDLMHMHTWMRICIAEFNRSLPINSTNSTLTANTTLAENSTTAVNARNSTPAALQFMDMRNCIQQLMKEHCYQQKLLVKEYIQRGDNASICANISAETGISNFTKVFQECMAEITLEDITDIKQSAGSIPRSTKSRSELAQIMLESTACTIEKMNWSTPERGLNISTYRNYVANFSGWNEIPKVLEKLSVAMNTCVSNYTGDIYTQVYNWIFCFKPAVIQTCGFKSNLTEFLIPFTAQNIREASKDYIEELMGTDDESASLRTFDDTYGDTEDGDEEYFDHLGDEFGTRGEKTSVEMVDDGLFKGPGDSRHRESLHGTHHSGELMDEDTETVTESAEVEVTGEEKAQLQLKKVEEISNSKEDQSRESEADTEDAITERASVEFKDYEDSLSDTDDDSVFDVTEDDSIIV
ncbi:hypothetical protein SK128_011946 [Halocaridina rubra]|uniref:Uncharacterized protein n=1 Tax=Halocaridina rubra TaxID=373956 RepID=A0AAN8XPF0_HALRR